MIAFVMFLVVLGSIVFHLLSPWWWTPIASNWGGIDSILQLTFALTGFVFAAVIGFMIYCIYKFRKVPGRKGAYEPESKKTEITLTAVTTVGIIALLAPGLVVWDEYVSPPDNVVPIEVMGQQWYWSFRLPGEDGILGTSDARNINDENPFGINPDDPFGQDDVMIQSDVLNLKIDRPVKILLRSVDVLHNWYVPQFRSKMDAVPGVITFYWFEPNKVGEYEVLCAEYCGVGHYAMRGTVIVQDEQNYNQWLNEQETYSELVAKQNKLEIEKNKIVKKIDLN